MSKKPQAGPVEVLPILQPAPAPQLPAIITPDQPALAPLAEMATAINIVFEAETTASSMARDKRIEAGRLLKEVRDRLAQYALNKDKPHSISFDSWITRNIKRSKSDCYACIKLISASDPIAAREAEKASNRQRQIRHRAAGQSVTSQTTPSLPPALPPIPITVPWESMPLSVDMFLSAMMDMAQAIGTARSDVGKDARNLPKALANAIAAAKTFLHRITPQSDSGTLGE